MAGIEVSFDAQKFAAEAHRMVQVELPAAIRAGMRSAANRITHQLGLMLADKLDDPVPFTQRGFYAEVSTAAAEPEMEIGVRPMQAAYLQYVFDGGVDSNALVPTADTDLDRYGNIPRGYLAAEQAQGAVWMTARSGVRTLFEDGKGRLKAVAMIVDEVSYDKLVDFETEVSIAVSDLLPDAVADKLAIAFG
ncbi:MULTISPECIES: hypothetical protein [unclassified Ensifer]|uniref:hypothetical protein n=1 Tax=unclassified Ensifer TaxID=2633371 RepID=UPI0008136E1B|nr:MULTISPECIES: hypothetical protein [unclassified Ensifer]OCP07972.1 hypothetical protein BC362_10200 [Ensifer sp. LC14]OCP10918.1 hypothetical protein BC374_17765 [Ensifer sp. LC13]OCP11537.1 hypothetical protein BBX50_18090 [Ensifer sp. LC11]OCP33355.1 hypothetical protein BC364_16980 [Ensifer sp. LC499]